MAMPTQTFPIPPIQMSGRLDRVGAGTGTGGRKNPIVDRGDGNKTWMKYRLRNPRLRCFDQPVVDEVVRPASHVAEVSIAKAESAVVTDPVVSAKFEPRMPRHLPNSTSRIPVSAASSLQRSSNAWASVPVKRVGGPTGWVAAAAMGASAWLMSSSHSAYGGVQGQSQPSATLS